MRLLCIMHEATPRGYLLLDGEPPTAKQLAAITGATLKELATLLAELRAARVYSIDGGGWIYSRRMVKDTQASEKGRETGRLGGNPNLINGEIAKEDRKPRFRRVDHPRRVERVFEKSDGRCHWCNAPLAWDEFHVDHVIAIRDGGGNDESNLVAACPPCNGKRAVGLTTTATPPTTEPLTPSATVELTPSHNPESDSEVQSEPDKEERKVLKLPTLEKKLARARTENPSPDSLSELMAEAKIPQPEGKLDPNAITAAHVRRVTKACTMSIPYGEVRSVEAQIDAMRDAQPAAVGAEVTMGLKWRPVEPVRSVAEQLAWLAANP
jgi:hypothetical protein